MGFIDKLLCSAAAVPKANAPAWNVNSKLTFFELEQRTVFDGAMAATADTVLVDQTQDQSVDQSSNTENTETNSANSDATTELIEALGLSNKSVSPVELESSPSNGFTLPHQAVPEMELAMSELSFEQGLISESAEQEEPLIAVSDTTNIVTEIVFVDTSVDNFQSIIDDILNQQDSGKSIDVVLIESDENGIQRITDTLSQYQNIDAVHIISHGSDGAVSLGNTVLNASSLQSDSSLIDGWGNAFSDTGDLLIYGCDLTSTLEGEAFIEALANLTDADVAASDDLTGHETLGGDWVLETTTGDIESAVIVSEELQENWIGALDITTGLVGHWNLDANANDASGNNYNGILSNGATIDTSSESNKVGSGKLALDGTNDHVDLDAHVAGFSGLSEGTIAGWVNTTTGEGTIFSISDIADASSDTTLRTLPGGRILFEVYENDSPLLAVRTVDSINDGSWHHIAVTVNGSGNTLYIDGVAVPVVYITGNASTTSFISNVSNLDSMDIGRRTNSGGGLQYFDGQLDDVRVYNRALAAADITELANEAPTAIDDAANTTIDTPVIIDLTSNDTDLDGETITVLDVANPANGTVANNDDGTVTYTPNLSFTGADSFDYLAADLDDTTSYWRLDGSAADAVGSNNGIIAGPTTVAGVYGDALSFDEVNDIVVVPDFAVNDEFSVSFKFKVDDNTGSLFQYIYSHGDVNTTNSLNIFLNEDSHGTDPNQLRTVIRDTNDTLDNLALQFDASAIVGDGQWHTYTLTVGTGVGAKVYLDGTLQNSDATRGGDAFDPATDLFFGTRQDLLADRFYGGELDSVHLFNRTLSAAEVSDTHTGGASLGTVNVNVLDNQLVVDTTSDVSDGDTSSISALNASKGADGFISLREAITATNNSANFDVSTPDQIFFNIAGTGPHTISLLSALPDIVDAVIIDGTTDPDFAGTPIIGLDGSGAGAGIDGLHLVGSSGTTIRGLMIYNFSDVGIDVDANSDNVVIEGNYIGTDGTSDLGNAVNGIDVSSTSDSITIGGSTAAQRNVISGNNGWGILSNGGNNHIITGNYIGVAADGVAVLGNDFDGIKFQNGTNGGIIGGNTAGERNVISANRHGIQLQDSSNISILGNYIGTDAGGSLDLGNTQTGILLNANVSNSTIGGTTAASGNLIRYNSIGLTTNTTGISGNTALGNSIYGNDNLDIDLGADGVTLNDAEDVDAGANNLLNFPVLTNVFQNGANLDIDFEVDLPAGNYRIEFLDNPDGLNSSNFGGGQTYIGFANITVTGAVGYESFSTTLTSVTASVITNITTTATEADGTFTNFASTSEFGPQFIGAGILEVDTTSDVSDGDTTSIASLLGNRGADGFISLREAIIATNNTANIGGTPDRIEFNISAALVGGAHTIDIGAIALPSITDAVVIDGSTEPDFVTNGNQPVIVLDGGGFNNDGLRLTSTADGSLIRGLAIRNFGNAIDIDSGSDGHTIVGNYLGGLDHTGTDAGASEWVSAAIIYSEGANTTFGGLTAADRNVISGGDNGIYLDNATATGNQIIGNYIGTDATGNAVVGMTWDGVHITNGATGNMVGGVTAAHRNVISGTDQDSVQVTGEASDGNIVQGNYLGVSADGTANLTTATNRGGGIHISSGADNTTVEDNWIAGFYYIGIEVDGASTGTTIQGNRIGTDATGTLNWGTGENAILLENGASNTLIGGTSVGDGNILAFSGQISVTYQDGIKSSGVGTVNTFLGNNFFGNLDQGIELGADGVTYNDAEDVDTGANDLLNFPVLTNVVQNGANLDIDFSVDLPAGNYRIEFFDNSDGLDASGFGEGQTFIGFANITATGAVGYESFSTTLVGITASAITNITTTATEADGTFTNFASTSEFGPQFIGAGILEVGTTSDVSDGDTSSIASLLGNRGADGFISLREAIAATNNTAGTDTINFDIAGAGPHTISLVSALPAIIDAVIIDGTTNPDFAGTPIIVLDGSGAGIAAGLTLSNTSDGSTIQGLVINQFSLSGILLSSGSDNQTIVGNYIGTDVTGTLDLGNGTNGIQIVSDNNVIGGNTSALRNIISGNDNAGIWIQSATGNTVIGNYIGTDVTGTAAIGNTVAGILLPNNATGNTIGGTGAGERNLISGNLGDGVSIQTSSNSNTIIGNYIGTDVTGTIDLGNVSEGIFILDTLNTNVENNLLSGNNHGIVLGGTTSGSTITGNLIGTDATGTFDLGNSDSGITIHSGASNNTVGGTTVADRNLISGNDQKGIRLAGTGTAGNVISGNYIGTDITGTLAIGNLRGIISDNGTHDNVIGGTVAGAGNLIRFNNGTGIDLVSSNDDGNAILGNAIFANAGMGIDLNGDGISYNDAEDVDTGSNEGLNFPILTNVVQNGADLDINFDVDLIAGNYRIEFFDNSGGLDANGFGEGQTYIGFANITVTGAAGYESFLITLTSVTASAVTNITTTATVTNGTFTSFGSTSEFGPQFIGAGVLEVDTTSDVSDGDTSSIAALLGNRGADGFISLREAISATNNTTNIGGNPDEIHFEITDTLVGGAHTINLLSVLPFITDAVIIDASTDSDFGGTPIVVLDGNDIAGDGLTLTATADGSTIRGLIIRDFAGDGIQIDTNSDGNLIAGNWLGRMTISGTDAGIGEQNVGRGLNIFGSNNRIGGTTVADRNILSGNSTSGIYLFGSSNVITGNYIGTNSTGTSVIGNGEDGIFHNSGTGNRIGGSAAGEGNLISGNNRDGIEIFNVGSSGAIVQGNLIGTDVTGTGPLGNGGQGVWIGWSTSGNLIGGTGVGEGNTIAYNGQGITTHTTAGTGNSFLGNSIYSNTGLGIDINDDDLNLANDVNDVDTGPNNQQNFPVLFNAVQSGGDTIITGNFNSNASTTYRIEFFHSPLGTEDASGYGEGVKYIGFATITTDGSGNATINETLSGVSIPVNDRISATATVDLGGGNYGDTSEFSMNVAATAAANNPPVANPDSYTVDMNSSLTTSTASVNTLPDSINGPQSLQSADVDGDGDVDLLSASSNDRDLSWLENDGTGNFVEHQLATEGGRAKFVSVADVDGDGDLDILANFYEQANTVVWYENDGSENFTQRNISTLGANSIIAVDVDGDTDIDLVVTAGTTLAWYENDGAENFTQRIVTAALNGSNSVSATDIDGDTDVDFVVSASGDNAVFLYQNDGAENFSQSTVGTANGPISVHAADMNGDGDIDVVVGSVGDDTVAWFENDGSENFTKNIITNSADNYWTSDSVHVVDFDRDGDLDVFSASAFDDTVAWYENDGSGIFVENNIDTAADFVTTITTGDFDGSGYLDIAASIWNTGRINIYTTDETLIRNDTDADGDALAVNTTPIVDVSDGTLVLNADGTFQYTPTVGFSGVDSFTYEISDGNGGTSQAVVNITVNPVNEVPVATGNTVVASEDVPLVIGAGDFNFTDVETDPLASVTINGLNLNGGTLTHTGGTVPVTNGMTITLAQLADLTFTSALNDSTNSSFTYTVNDAGLGVTSSTMNITVNAVNDAPVITDIFSGGSASEGSGHAAFGSENLTDVDGGNFDGGSLTFTVVSTPNAADDTLYFANIGGVSTSGSDVLVGATIVGTFSGGSGGTPLVVMLNSDATVARTESVLRAFAIGNFSQDPVVGVRTIEAVLTDGDGGTSNISSKDVNFTATNDVPVATGNTVVASEDVPLVIGAGDFNFTDVETDPLASVTITGLNLNGGTLTHSAGVVTVTNGMTVTLAQLADLTFTSALNDSTNSSFTYTVNDAGSGVTSSTMNITVNAINDVPVATGNTVVASEDVPLVIGAGDFNFTDVETDPLASVTITGLNLNGGTLTHSAGVVTVTNGMTVTLAQLADLTFTSALNDSTNSSFTYTVNDAGSGVTSSTMNITVNAINDVPVATGNTVIASEDVPLVIGAGDFNFTDVETDPLASVTITGLNLNGGTLTHSAGVVTVTNGMTVTLAQLADLTFTSALNDSTNSSFTYTVNDAGSGVTSSTMNITVNAINDVPVATGNTVVASEDVPLVIGAGDFNFTDVETDPLASVTITGLNLNGGTLTHSAGVVTVTNGMTVTLAQLADLTFTSALNDSTNSSFTYTVNDAGSGVTSSTMNITVNAINDVPVATGNTVVASEDVPLVIGAGDFNFTDVETDPLASVTITGLNLNGGTLTHSAGVVTVTNGMTVTLAQLADLTFTSALNDSTNSSFTYTVNDAGSGVTSSTMNITVNAINDVPVATGNTVVASEDVPLVIGAGDFNFTDVETDPLASVTITGLNLNGGTLTHSAGVVTVTNGMTVTLAQLADLTFTSALNDSTNSSFTYTVNDAGSGVTSSTMNITVNAINDVPVATGNTVVASEDVPLVIGAGDFNFTDVETDPLASVTITGLNLNGGTLTHSAGVVTVTNGMTVTLAQLADLTFTSALNDSTNSSFTYTVNDAGSGVTSSTMNITVNAINDVPVATGNTVVASEDVPLVIGAGDFNFTDVETDPLASVTITGLNLNGGTLTHSAGVVTVTNGMTVTLAQLADLTFTSALNDSTNSSFTYTVNDAGSGVTSAVMNITVNAINDVPVATGNTVIASEDVPLVIGAGDFNFTDVETDPLASVTITGLNLNGGTLTHSAGVVTVTNGMTVTLAELADLTFTSALNDSTNSSFTYTVNDAGSGVTSSTMNITVNAINDVPVATGNTVVASEDVPLVIGAGDFNFTDVETDPLASVTITGLNLNGGTLTHSAGVVTVTNGMTVTLAELADLTFTSALNDSTNSSFTYTVNDAGSGVTSAVMNITVNAINDVPVATGNTVIASEDVPLVIGAGDFNFTDVETDPLASVTITGLNLNGGTLTHSAGVVTVTNGMTVTLAELADLTFTSALNDSTNSSFTYTVNDAGSGVTSSTMNITVNAINDVPVATGNTVIASEDVPLVIGAGDFNFTDVETDPLASVTITGLNLNGGTLTHSAGVVTVTNGMTVTLAELADLTFTSALNDSTNSSFTYTVNDAGSGVTSAVMNITVNAINDVPVATGNTVIASEDVPLVIGAGDFNFTDVETDPLASVTITGLNLNGGTLTHSAGVVTVTNGMTVTLAELADLTFTSALNDSTNSSFTYTVNDAGSGVTSAVMNITVNAINDVPVATGNTVIASEDVPLVIGAGDFNFTDVETDPLASVTITGLNLNGGTLTHSAGVVTVTNGMTVTLAELADLTFTSALNDSTNSSFTYTVNDAGSGVTSAVMNITVNAINDVPVATGNTVIASEDVPLVIGAGDFNFTDVETDPLASVTITGLNLNGGTLTHSAGVVTVTNGMTVTLAELADLTFTSALNDSTNSSFTYTVNDAGSGVTSAVMNITVNAINDAPTVSTNVGVTVLEGALGTTITNLMLNEGDTDDSGAGLTFTITSNPAVANGILRLSGAALTFGDTFTQLDIDLGNLVYDHDDSETISDSFSFSLADGGEDGALPVAGTFNITVTPVNDNAATPITDTDAVADIVDENSAIGTVVGIAAYAFDADVGDIVTYTLDNNDGGRFAIDLNSGVVWVAGAIDREVDGASRNITVRATSTDGSFSTQIFAIAINDVNEFAITPVVDVDATANNVDENVAVGTIVGITANATDADATTNTITYTLDDNDDGRFSVEAATGIVRVAGSIDREADGASRNITVRATSADGSTETLVFNIIINDVGDTTIITPPPPPPPIDPDPEGPPIPDNPTVIPVIVPVDPNSPDDDDTIDVVIILPTKPNGTPTSSENTVSPILEKPTFDEEEAPLTPTPEIDIPESNWIELPVPDLGLKEVNKEAFFKAIEEVKSDIERNQHVWQSDLAKLSAGANVALTAGYVSWVLRGGALLSAMLTSFSVWQTYDPLFVILARRRKDEKGEKDLSKADHLFSANTKFDIYKSGVSK